jgi:hypothetical protein
MAEISEKQRALRKKHKDPGSIKVIFRCDATRKARLDELVEYHNTDMSAFCRKFIDIAWAAKERGEK